jgi:hypothetical protein
MQWNIFRERRFWLISLLLGILLAASFPSLAQEGENLCRSPLAQTMEYGDRLSSFIDSQVPYAFFCFEGERGDDVTVTVEVTDGNLTPIIIITDPVYNEEDLQNPLGSGVANREGGTAVAEFSIDSSDTYLIVIFGDQNTLGAFDISIDAAGSSILGGGSDTGEETDEPTETPEDIGGGNGGNGGNTSTGGVDMSEIEFGETNLCRLDTTEFLDYGDSVSGELDSDSLVSTWYCFEGRVGDSVTVEVGTSSGDIVMIGLIADPFFDLTENTMYTLDIANNRSDSAEIEFEVPEDGDYLIWVQLGEGESGELYLEISADEAIPLDCTAEPLSLLTSQQWMIAPAEGEAAVVLLNLSCDGQLAISTMGAPEIGYFELNEAGGIDFDYGDRLFTTVSLDATTWTVANMDGTEYTLVPVVDTACTDETLLALINGRWQSGRGDSAAFLSFTCNGIVIVNVQGQTIVQNYSFEDGTITIDLGDGAIIAFEDVVIEGDELNATVEGEEASLDNVLAD